MTVAPSEVEGRLVVALRSLAVSPSKERGDVTLQMRQHIHDFDEAYTDYIGGLSELPSHTLLAALQSLDSALLLMLDDDSESLWSAAAIEGDTRWSGLRVIAAELLLRLDSASSLGAASRSRGSQP